MSTPLSVVLPDIGAATTDFDRPLVSAALLAASVLRHAAISDGAAQTKALKIAKRALGRVALKDGCSYDEGKARVPIDVFRLLAERVSREGFLTQAREILEGLRWCRPTDRQLGKVEIEIARYWRAQGFVDLSEAQLRKTRSNAQKSKEGGIVAYATIGLAACAQVRGDLRRMRALSQQGAEAARRLGLRRLAASGYIALGMADAMATDHSHAIVHLWEGYVLGKKHPLYKREALGNLSQVLLLSGKMHEAQRLAAHLLRERLSLRHAMPILGSFTVASSNLGDRESTLWGAAQAERLTESGSHPRETATLLIEAGLALVGVGEYARGDLLKRRGEEIARTYEFSDLLDPAGLSRITVAPRPLLRLMPKARAVVSTISRLPGSRPARVLLDAA